FVYNLARYIGQLGCERKVVRNDAISIEEIKSLAPTHIVISPGPCTPNEAGISLEVVKALGATTPILGICLGHQAIAQAYGANVIPAKTPMHGKMATIHHDNSQLFQGIPSPLNVGRYHSLAVNNLPDTLKVTAQAEDGEIMALQHKHHPVYGLQFHPESVLTEYGYQLLGTFLRAT
ncbi:unnamed protein product, partial [marine sediment metagenome]